MLQQSMNRLELSFQTLLSPRIIDRTLTTFQCDPRRFMSTPTVVIEPARVYNRKPQSLRVPTRSIQLLPHQAKAVVETLQRVGPAD